jgi:hypothetical protein
MLGNDFFDLSNIVGAGGNLTVMQVGEPSTLKGDPLFMQHLNTAWKKADQRTKNACARCVHLDRSGNVIRIDAIKDNPAIEPLIRTFADNKTYIGVGAWNGSPGHPSDNNQVSLPFNSHKAMLMTIQSRAGKGNKDIIVTYNDGDATPDMHPKAHLMVQQADASDDSSISVQSSDVSAEADDQMVMATTSFQATQGEHDDGKAPGIILHNKSKARCSYFFFDNYWNGNGTAGANFDKPLKSVDIPGGGSAFIGLPLSFKGRVQRGKIIPATWVEFQLKASNDGAAHGDVSVQQGNDGPATITSTDAGHHTGGFTEFINLKPFPGAHVKRSDGKDVIASTVGNWMGGPNQAAIDLQQSALRGRAYVVGGTGVPDVSSHNNRFVVNFY